MGKSEPNIVEQPDGRQSGANTALSPHAEASRMLEAALQQMDGIISGVKMDPDMAGVVGAMGPPSTTPPALTPSTLPTSSPHGIASFPPDSQATTMTVSEAVELLSAAAERQMSGAGGKASPMLPPPSSTRSFLVRWLTGITEITAKSEGDVIRKSPAAEPLPHRQVKDSSCRVGKNACNDYPRGYATRMSPASNGLPESMVGVERQFV
ncbi:uncharacterized protein [Hetaerina americana]|uniref:uncharacterized protein n=1 Tax=Hetaerina americana TaxID=62018 RepID=UPI003A7F4E22